jgi:Ribbon-helix-helix protein, copG family
MSRPLENEDYVGFRLPAAMHRTLEVAARSTGTNKSAFIRAVVLQALRHKQIALSAIEGADAERPSYPSFVSSVV